MYMFSSLEEFIEYCKLMNNIEDLLVNLTDGYFVAFKFINNARCFASAITGEYVIDELWNGDGFICYYVELV